MHPKLDEYLCKKYPELFINRLKSPTETCLCWGLECSDGWFYLINSLCSEIQDYIDNPPLVPNTSISYKLKYLWNRTGWKYICYPTLRTLGLYDKYHKYFNFDLQHYVKGPKIPQVRFDQIKEKYSVLRIYYTGGDEVVDKLINYTMNLSGAICEDCGIMNYSVGHNTRGWISTTCHEHTRNKEDFKYNGDEELIQIWDEIIKK